MAALIKLKRPPVYEFSVRDIIQSQVILGFHLPMIYTPFSLFLYEDVLDHSIWAGIFLHSLFCLWLLYKYFKARVEDIPSQFYHPDLLPNDEYLALKRKYKEAQKGIFLCRGFFGQLLDLTNEDKKALLKSYQDIVDAISPILTTQNDLRALCSFKMTFGHVETEAVYERDDEVVESVPDAEVSPSAPLSVGEEIVETAELQPPQSFEISAAEYDIKSKSAISGDSNGYLRRRSGFSQFTNAQLEILKSEFVKAQFVDDSLGQEIAEKTGLSETCVQKWFKNRRAQCRYPSRSFSPIVVPSDIPNPSSASSSTPQIKDQNEDLSTNDSIDGRLEATPIPSENKNEFIQQLQKRVRNVFTAAQLKVLETEFKQTQYPNCYQREEIAAMTGLTEERVQIWFKNRRAHFRQSIYYSQMVLPANKIVEPNTPNPSSALSSVVQVQEKANEEKIQNRDLAANDSTDDQLQAIPLPCEKKNELNDQQYIETAEIDEPMEKPELLQNHEIAVAKSGNEFLEESLEQIFESQLVF